MNWKQHLIKPRWQHKDAGIRREAVSSLQETELLDALPRILLEDEDAEVRKAAARRLTDLPGLFQAQSAEPDSAVLDIIGQRLQSLCAASSADRPDLKDRKSVVEQSKDRQLLELVASHAPEAELRKLALQGVSRQGFLGDRAVNDPDPDIRVYAASQVEQLSTLRRVIEQTRKTDKSLHQSLSTRLHAELLGAMDPKAVKEEALELCLSLEQFALLHIDSSEEVPVTIAEGWVKIENATPADLKARYGLIVERLSHATIVVEPEPAVEPEPVVETVQDEQTAEVQSAEEDKEGSETESQTVNEADHFTSLIAEIELFASRSGDRPKIGKLKQLREKWDRAVDEFKPGSSEAMELVDRAHNAFNKLQAQADAFLELRDQALNHVEALLKRLSSQLEDGSLHKALNTRHQLTELGKNLRNEGRWKAVNRQISDLQGRLRELRDWQHWSNDKVRNQLIAQMEMLPETDLHPDAILDRVKSLQMNWKSLEAGEQIPGDSHYHAAPWMWKKFSAAGNKAFDATKPYLEKRDEIRDKHLQRQKELCQQVNQLLSSESLDHGQLTKMMAKLRLEMQDLDLLPHKARRTASSRLRKVLEKGNAAMQGHYGEIEKQKLKLIRAASQLVHLEDNDQAINEAKRLQAEWKTAGRLWRKRENELWQDFREPLDPLFGKLKANQESERAVIKERLEAQETLCRELKELMAGSDQELLDSEGKIQGLKDQWRNIEQPNHQLQKQFQDMAAKFDRSVAGLRTSLAEARREDRWDKARLLHKLELASSKTALKPAEISKAEKKWVQGADDETDRILDERFQSVISDGFKASTSKDTVQSASLLAIQLEFLAGLASPDSDKQLRMSYQVERLSKSLSGEGERLSAIEEARKAEHEWLKLPLLPARAYTGFERRISAALKDIYRNNSV
jgi:exonuclease SbcC